jgi:dTDP-4-dehydrorhamnose 3,5-epimerase
MMKFIPSEIPDVVSIEPEVLGDERGFFMETYQQRRFEDYGISTQFVQDNQSGSRKGILRGLHYQIRQPQGKLVRVVVGEIFDVAVDLRRRSTTFGRWVGQVLSAENRLQLWIHRGSPTVSTCSPIGRK